MVLTRESRSGNYILRSTLHRWQAVPVRQRPFGRQAANFRLSALADGRHFTVDFRLVPFADAQDFRATGSNAVEKVTDVVKMT
jgi:hypothetical protein